ncbi:hypothetical protein BLA29_015550 [Euroglyphus maynei]|uniref:Uncharacterized protein n=1 Tax=Euroglyphus maynei TaxID=6958 RepID=A0A1Y3AQT6_EURMA|nr:hypothetical protein BLA29_015550 [Euroglyphus maynei]
MILQKQMMKMKTLKMMRQ